MLLSAGNFETILRPEDVCHAHVVMFPFSSVMPPIISLPPENKRNIVGLGSRVYLEIDGMKDCFEIVGSAEANPSVGRISNESPVGRALLGLKKGEEVIISSPIKTKYKIKKIEYPKEN